LRHAVKGAHSSAGNETEKTFQTFKRFFAEIDPKHPAPPFHEGLIIPGGLRFDQIIECIRRLRDRHFFSGIIYDLKKKTFVGAAFMELSG